MNCNLTDKEREAGILCRSFDCIPCRRYNNNTLTHLMSRIGPFSFCDMRLRDNSGMRQTFKLSEVTCLKCKEYAEIEFYDYIKQLEQKQKELDEAIEVIEFYANHENWEGSIEMADGKEIRLGWMSNLKIKDCYMYNCGGGKAREFLKKYEEKK